MAWPSSPPCRARSAPGNCCPRTSYTEVAGVSQLPPYNEHLLTDLGGLNLAVGFGLAVAAATPNRSSSPPP